MDKLTDGQKNYQWTLKRKLKKGSKSVNTCSCGLLFVGTKSKLCTSCRGKK